MVHLNPDITAASITKMNPQNSNLVSFATAYAGLLFRIETFNRRAKCIIVLTAKKLQGSLKDSKQANIILAQGE